MIKIAELITARTMQYGAEGCGVVVWCSVVWYSAGVAC